MSKPTPGAAMRAAEKALREAREALTHIRMLRKRIEALEAVKTASQGDDGRLHWQG